MTISSSSRFAIVAAITVFVTAGVSFWAVSHFIELPRQGATSLIGWTLGASFIVAALVGLALFWLIETVFVRHLRELHESTGLVTAASSSEPNCIRPLLGSSR